MPLKTPPQAPGPAFSWTGLYLGGEIGGGWATTQTTHVDGNAAFPAGWVNHPVHESGFLGGAYAGYNYQIGQYVVGIDGDYTGADLRGTGTDVGPTGFVNTDHDRFNWIATVTGRIGYAVNSWLLYGKGGWAWSGYHSDANTFLAGANVNNGAVSYTRDGWTLGLGTEYAFASHWSARLEYDYVGFRTQNFRVTDVAVAGGAVTTPARSATGNLNMLKGGIAYRF
jgi:outer membrane immunogenic protein